MEFEITHNIDKRLMFSFLAMDQWTMGLSSLSFRFLTVQWIHTMILIKNVMTQYFHKYIPLCNEEKKDEKALKDLINLQEG